MENSKLRFILASSSPRRKELIGHLKIPFQVITSNALEESPEKDPEKFCLEIAKIKGETVYRGLKTQGAGDSYLVVSSDTIVACNGVIYGKPQNRDDARIILRELAGHSHSVFTAVSAKLLHRGEESGFDFVEESVVHFTQISDALLERYLDTGDSLDKAGAYGIQGPSLTFISRVEGDYANVVGFPLSRFVREAEAFLKKKFPEEDVWLNLF